MIQVEGLSKKYCKDLKRAMRYAAEEVVRSFFHLYDYSNETLREDEFWSLNNVNFVVQPGEALGLIGPNGAGKSTLLKLLSGILEPDLGRIKLVGKVGSLIELGAGFHPQLTGRENIFVNGSILGLRHRDIIRRLDDIIAFASLEDFIDTPVKYYSSGMYVRLGFAIAAHVEPHILLVDEVLSVGDLAFQSRCLERIEQMRRQGTTFVFVSHDLSKISRLCPQTLLLDQGEIAFLGSTPQAIDCYRRITHRNYEESPGTKERTDEVEITGLEILDPSGQTPDAFDPQSTIHIRTHFRVYEKIKDPVFNIAIFTADTLQQCTGFRTDIDQHPIGSLSPGEHHFDLLLPECPLLPNHYLVSATIWKPGCLAPFAWRWHDGRFQISGGQEISGICQLLHHWQT